MTTEQATPEELWLDILEKDDRTSPEEYPDMALITFEEFRDNLKFFSDQHLAAANERIARLEGALQPMIEALEFYADPETYCAIAVIADPPCGAFAEDFSDDHGHPSLDGNRYGKTARKAFELADAALSPPGIATPAGMG